MLKVGTILVETSNPEVKQEIRSKFKHEGSHYFVLVKQGEAAEFYIAGKRQVEEAIMSERVMIVG